MKKFLIILVALIGLGFSANAQNTVIIQQHGGNKAITDNKEPNEVKGVEYTLEYNDATDTYHFICENYNSFAVSCEYFIQAIYNSAYNSTHYSMGDVVNEQSGDFVIRANEKKDFDTKYGGGGCRICKIQLKSFKSYRL
ncbi:MAG: hypothetical protein LBC68_09465 [Prevotellaceae bacterium]|jgi:hypothetical protein|nr:hypothetical protein [Prevotellaceae bacterium]